jgi:flagellar biosynthesis protein FlhG
MVKTIAFASGKGGVGKTSIAVNSAIKLQLDNYRVALLDADFGMANSHIILNQKIERSLYDLIEKKVDLASIVCETASGLKLIPGGSGIIELLDLSSEKRFEIIRSISTLGEDLDYLVVDTPAGGAGASLEFAAACDEICIVLVGEPTSFMDAYSFIKALHLEKKCERVSVIVNMAASQAEAGQTFSNFAKAVTKFMSVELKMIGWLPRSKALQKSIVARQPLVLDQKATGNSIINNFEGIVSHLKEPSLPSSRGLKFFSGV